MTPDLLALATDVDRLFRARQDGRQMPVGEMVHTLEGDGWQADPCEWRACPKREEQGWYDHPVPLTCEHKSLFRTRRHVAMLALTEPAHFERCLAEIDVRGDWPIDSDDPEPCRFMGKNVRMAAGMRARGAIAVVKHYRYPATKEAADIARTAAFLTDLQERLRLFHEAEAVRADNDAVAREAKERAEADAITDAGIEVDGDLLAEVA